MLSKNPVDKLTVWMIGNNLFPGIGKMTKDLALITSLENITVLNSEGFIKAIREELDKLN